MENASQQDRAAQQAAPPRPAMTAIRARTTIVLTGFVSPHPNVRPTILPRTIATKTNVPKIPARASMSACRSGYAKIMTLAPTIPA